MAPKLLIAIAAALCFAATGMAQSPRLPPNDSAQYSIVILTRDVPCRDCERLADALSHPDVAAILRSTKLFSFTPRSAIYQLRYAETLASTEAPTIALVRSDGGVIYKASGPNIPEPVELAYQLRRFASLDQGLVKQPVRNTSIGNGDEYASRRPRLIPDTVVVQPKISPTVNVAAPNIVFIVIAGLVLLVCAGALLAFILLALFLAIR
jgi:hypothetical protein